MNNKIVLLLTLLLSLLFGSLASAHSGRTDSSGGHNCSSKSQAKGLCSGYHYHNGGTVPVTTPTRRDKDCSDFSDYDEVVAYWNAKGYSATNDPENLDGWGNNVVDDGIPCEPPGDYDRTKINNSTEQKMYREEQLKQKELAKGEKAGFAVGSKHGYSESEKQSSTSKGSESYKKGYEVGYNKGYGVGKRKIEGKKNKVKQAGYTYGKTNSKLIIPAIYAKHPGLKESYEAGFNQAVNDLKEAEKEKYLATGYSDGRNDVYKLPKNVEQSYQNSYEQGYKQGQTELQDEYMAQGYEAAFVSLSYKDPELNNEKLIQWYKKGFDSNKEIEIIKNEGLSLGKLGEAYELPSKFRKSEVIFKHYYDIGYKEFKEQQKEDRRNAVGGVAALGFIWLGRRFYVARKMIR
jgi:hypothetical protein